MCQQQNAQIIYNEAQFSQIFPQILTPHFSILRYDAWHGCNMGSSLQLIYIYMCE